MLIKCWGSRGSIPVSGQEYLKYGGDTACIEIRAKSNDIVIVDAGTGIRMLGNKLIGENNPVYNIIFTHAHWDHIMGLPFFKPLYSKSATLRMHKCPFHGNFVENILPKLMSPPNFPVKSSSLKANIYYEEACSKEFKIGSLSIIPIRISHPNGGSGYKFIENNKIFVFLTDNELGFVHQGGLSYKDYMEFSSGAHLLIHDAEYTPDDYKNYIGWGHSEYTRVLEMAFEAGVKKLGLFHLNQERTDREMDNIVEKCKTIIAQKGEKLECFGVGSDMTFEL
ncbi:MAG: MBL fold metallo-hydrolase [Desulfobacterales bacterium]|nr:MBL fold metallo-hydrolase [Desulfobacterales bacterium]